MRNGAEVREEAAKWKKAVSFAERERLERGNGVRWTSLHRLSYWDLVKHVMLGYMHNWLEGVLMQHLRVLWGIGRDQVHEEQMKPDVDLRKEEAEYENWTESDVTESASELEELTRELEEEGRSQSSATSSRLRPRSVPPSPPQSPTPSLSEEMSVDSGSTTTVRPPRSETENEAFSDPEDDTYIDVPDDVYTLPAEYHKCLQQCIRDITLPTWVGRPPANLGEASHGKLRAYDYLVLFSFIFPLVVPKFWWAPDADRARLQNFHQLVVSTNIVCSFKTSNQDADEYTDLYIRYRRGIRTLYDYWNSKPNHHYAMHNGDILKYWGPIPPLSEFPGERLIGLLQNINTNKKLRK